MPIFSSSSAALDLALQQSVGFYNSVTYASYLAALTANSSGNAVDVAALAAMSTYDTPAYSGNQVVITSALQWCGIGIYEFERHRRIRSGVYY